MQCRPIGALICYWRI